MTRAPVSNLPNVDWSAERARITRALAGAGDLSVIARNDGNLQILIPGAEAFARDGIEPRSSLRATLDRISDVLNETPGTEILVIGHTDGVGSELHNMQLSIRRAEAVVEYMRVRGIALTRLQADGRGETEPFADNGTEAGRAKNRRVEIIVRPFAR
ncbi:OmpA family protein [Aromatoleum petrolei]|uniref:OmpA family protein n=1 Tax=Aromatoleum petrolei TaxID=76116 RepID=A0ABX1MR81_9RHOO|nr:OmpA family protein [Aromatoleum petrolei]